MLVEDDALLRDSLSLFFRSMGCDVTTFPDAESSLESLEQSRFDLVISDNRLPGIDGLSFLKEVGVQHPETIRILITAYPEEDIVSGAEEAGIDDFIQKPFTAERLVRSLRDLLGRRGRRGGSVAERA